MKTAFVFPGQGAQFIGMGKDLYENYPKAKELFESANTILGFRISDIMFSGTDEELKQTKVTQPAVFLHSVIRALVEENRKFDFTAGHSLGEFSALVLSEVLSFEDALKLVSVRANAMQKACENNPGTMAAILGLEDSIVEDVCSEINSQNTVVAANYNCIGQLVISGSLEGVNKACEELKAKGAKRALVLPVGGAFHSPLMKEAENELTEAIHLTQFNDARVPVFQNVNGLAQENSEQIQKNLIMQLTSPVKWTQSVLNMIAEGVEKFVEIGPGKALSGMIKKIDRSIEVSQIS